MKRIFIWFGLASITVAAAAASCSINHRSGQFECDTTQDCDLGRTCSEGLCVTPGGGDGGIDAPKKDAALDGGSFCPSPCTSCPDPRTCVIDCAAGANCGSQITCPTGFACDVRCSLESSCRSGVNCSGATSCTVQCTGRSSCRGVLCGPGPCAVNCPGPNSCETVTCGLSCACDVRCPFANGACFNVQCNRSECDTGRGCSSTIFPTCDTCP
jgi:hypothetical protein